MQSQTAIDPFVPRKDPFTNEGKDQLSSEGACMFLLECPCLQSADGSPPPPYSAPVILNSNSRKLRFSFCSYFENSMSAEHSSTACTQLHECHLHELSTQFLWRMHSTANFCDQKTIFGFESKGIEICLHPNQIARGPEHAPETHTRANQSPVCSGVLCVCIP